MDSSPFHPGTKVQWAWDSTSLGWLKECPRKYQYHMIEAWRGRGESIHLEYGILYHEALESYDRMRYEGGMSHDDAVKWVVRELLTRTWREGKPWRAAMDLPADDKASLKSRENLVRTVVWYLSRNSPSLWTGRLPRVRLGLTISNSTSQTIR
jgi:hypothetical protein